MSQMKAMVRDRYCDVEGLRLDTVDVPDPAEGEIRLRVHVASLNPADRYFMLGQPYMIRAVAGFRRPRRSTFGSDVAGVVDAVGPGVTGFAAGDRVLAGGRHGFAEYAVVKAAHAAVIPDGVSMTDAASLPIAGCTALQGLRKAGLEAGQRILVNGASGGVGHFAVQLAAAGGAEVTGICSTPNVDVVKGLGAADVIDYTTTDYATVGRTWDVIVDNMGNRPPAVNRELLARDGRWVLNNGPMTSRWIGPMRYVGKASLAMARSTRKLVQFTAVEHAEDLAILLGNVASGTITPHIQRSHPLVELPDAIRHLATGRTVGKVAITIGDPQA